MTDDLSTFPCCYRMDIKNISMVSSNFEVLIDVWCPYLLEYMMSSNGGFNSKGSSHDADEKKQGNDFCGKLRLLNFQEFQECNLACIHWPIEV